MLEIRNVSYIYGQGTGREHIALKNINLTIKKGEFVAIAGHTGSGKSTLIRLLNGLEKPAAGQVIYQGQDINEKEYDRRNLRFKVGMVFQYAEHQLFEISVIKDVMFGPLNQGLSEEEAEKRAYDALQLVGIGDEDMDISPFALSGGQKRRVAIAGILAMQPEVLILDEPAAGLDPEGKRELFQLFKELHEARKMTIILVSHSMEDVADTVDRLIVMNQGKIMLDGTPKKIFAYRRELEKIGLGVPKATEILQLLAEKGAEIDTTAITAGEAADAIVEWLKE